MQTIFILGNIGNPAQTRTTTDGKQLVSFSVAVSGRNKSTTWYGVIGRASENLLPYLSKGRQVFVAGELESKCYNGNVDLSIFADRIELCGKAIEESPVTSTPTPQTVKENGQINNQHIPTNAEKANGQSQEKDEEKNNDNGLTF